MVTGMVFPDGDTFRYTFSPSAVLRSIVKQAWDGVWYVVTGYQPFTGVPESYTRGRLGDRRYLMDVLEVSALLRLYPYRIA